MDRDATEIVGAAVVLKACSDCEFTDRYYVGGRASLGGVPDHVMFLASGATAATYAHEFGHILGMRHWHPNRSSIMASDGITKAGRVDVLRLLKSTGIARPTGDAANASPNNIEHESRKPSCIRRS